MNEPYELTRRAIAENELPSLVLGNEPYIYRNKWSPAPGATDLGDIYDFGICEYANQHPSYDMKKAIEELTIVLCQSNAGIYATSIILISEVYNKTHGKSYLGLDLLKLANELRQAIFICRDSLSKDQSLGGFGWPNGLLDEMRRLSKNTEEIGGPAFYN